MSTPAGREGLEAALALKRVQDLLGKLMTQHHKVAACNGGLSVDYKKEKGMKVALRKTTSGGFAVGCSSREELTVKCNDCGLRIGKIYVNGEPGPKGD